MIYQSSNSRPWTDEASAQKGYLCARYFTGVVCAFNLHAARRVTGNDKRLFQSPKAREMLCRYILRPPLANERLRLLEDGSVTVDFKRPWSDGTRSIGLAPKALPSRMAALIPPPRRHVTVYAGVLSSHSKWRRWIVPSHKPEPLNLEQENSGLETTPDLPFKPKAIETKSVSCRKYIPWNELLRRTFGSEIVCPNCGGAIRLMALVKTERTIQTILFGMGFPTGPPKAIASIAPIASIGEASPLKLKEEVDLEWSEEPQEWAE